MESILRLFGLFIVASALLTIPVSSAKAQSSLTDGLVAYFPFSGNANDVVGANSGTVYGATLANDRFGNPNHAYSFNGTSSYIRCSDAGFPAGNSPRTVSVWTKLAPSPYITYLTSYGVDGATNAFYSIVGPISSGATYIAVGKSGGGDAPSWNGLTTNGWYHVVITYNGATATLYVNGVSRAQASRTYGTTLTGNFYFGRYPAGFPPTFYGVIDDVRVYSRALSPQEVLSLYQNESQSSIALIKAVKPSFSNLFIGTNYQLQVSGDLNTWTNQGSPFAATNSAMIYPQYWDVENWDSLFFRLQIPP